MKICRRCKIEKPLSAFGKDRSRSDSLRKWCSDCRSIRREQIISARTIVVCEKATCTSCGIEKEIAEFSKDRSTASGVSSWCRDCHSDYRQRNRPYRLAYSKKYREEHPEIMAASNASWLRRNPEYRSAYARKYAKEKPHVKAAALARYIAAKLNATPAWADLNKIKMIYEQAARLTREIGIPHEVDHIYPLQSKVMCGLHVETNLQVVPTKVNQSKGNRIREVAEVRCCAWPDILHFEAAVQHDMVGL